MSVRLDLLAECGASVLVARFVLRIYVEVPATDYAVSTASVSIGVSVYARSGVRMQDEQDGSLLIEGKSVDA